MKYLDNNKIKEILRDKLSDYTNEDVYKLKNMVYSCNMYNGRLEDYHYYDHDDEFYEIMFASKDDAVRAVYYGGNNYCYTDEYVKINVYGNCETISSYEYDNILKENKDEIIDEYIEGLFNNFNYFIDDLCDDELIEEIKEIMQQVEV